MRRIEQKKNELFEKKTDNRNQYSENPATYSLF